MGYIVTTGTEETKSLPAPKRAYKFQDVVKQDSTLVPDIDYYIHKQIFPPIERLCAPIPGTDSVRLAECLGLDVRKYAISSSANNGGENKEISPLESQIPDEIRFKDATRLTLRCRSCKTLSVFGGLAESTSSGMLTPTGIVCPNAECAKPFSTITLVCQLEAQIRAQTSAYYEGWLCCSDETCGKRTRQMSVYGSRCLGANGRADGSCRGKMGYEYTEKALYNQLLYFGSLFDAARFGGDGVKIEGGEEEKKRVGVLADMNESVLGCLKGVVEGYLGKCGRRWVEMDGLFSYALC